MGVAVDTAAPTQATPEQLARIAKVSRDFEQSFLSIMLGEMTSDVKTSSFGGGEGEDAFKSFMNDAMAKANDCARRRRARAQAPVRDAAPAGADRMIHAADADDRCDQLLALTRRLTDAIAAETRAFEARRPHEAAAGQAAAAELATAYRVESARVKRDPSLLSAASPERRSRLTAATVGFEAALARHGRALAAAKEVTEGLVRAIATEVAAARAPTAGYGAQGRSAAGDASAITLNTRA